MFFHPVFIKIYVGEFYSISSIHFLVLFSLVIGSIQKACECAQNVWYCILYKNIKNCLTIIPYTQKLYSQTICSGQYSAAHQRNKHFWKAWAGHQALLLENNSKNFDSQPSWEYFILCLMSLFMGLQNFGL